MRVLVAVDAPVTQRLDEAGFDVVSVSADTLAEAVSDAAGSAGAAELLADLARADVVVVAARRAALTAELVSVCDRFGVRVVAIAGRTAQRRWAESFGVTVLAEDDDPTRVVETPREPATRTRGRVVAVWGPTGSPGRTTLAVELAAELARQGRRVGLLDADTHAPSIALALGLAEDGPGLAAACRRAEHGELSVTELVRISQSLDNIDVLTGINRPGRWPELSHARLAATLETCREWVDDVIVDVGGSLEQDEEIVSDLGGPRRNAATLSVLAHADDVVAVVAADPVGVARFIRVFQGLRAVAPTARVHVVANKTRPGPLGIDPRGQVRRTLERFAGIDRVAFLPWEPRAIDAALLSARPVGTVHPRQAFAVAVRRFVGEVFSLREGEESERSRRRRPSVPGVRGRLRAVPETAGT